MRIFHFRSSGIEESSTLPDGLPADGFVWLALERGEFEARVFEVQACLQRLTGGGLVDLHISDLLNRQLRSHYDYTGQYDVLVFRRLAQGRTDSDAPVEAPVRRSGPPILRRIDTSPVGFALFDRVLLTVHPSDCAVREAYASKLLGATVASRWLPTSAPDLMLRLVNHMVDGYLELRRELTRQLDHWQSELLSPRTRFSNWRSLLEARMVLHHLDEICEDQRAALQDWIDALNAWAPDTLPGGARELDLLQVRSRDVLEHIERVVHHVHRLEAGTEAAVQIHFNAQSHRANDIMRTLTVLTAVFLPLNLIAGIFGMNFEFIPFLHVPGAFWWALLSMGVIALALSLFFWRKRYLEHDR